MTTVAEALELARTWHQAGDFRQAEELYRQILAVDPENVAVLHLFGLLAHQVGQSDLAIDYLGAALRVQPDCAEVSQTLGEILRQQGRLEEAVACNERVVRLQPDNALAHNNLGVALQDQGKLAAAAACFHQALRLQPDNVLACNNLGGALTALGKLDEAETALREAIRLRPEFHQAHNNLSIVLRTQGKPGEALASSREALRFAPHHPEIHNTLGMALLAADQLEEASVTLQEALRLRPDSPQIANNLGLAWERQGRFEEALACYREALRLWADFPEAHNNLGNVLRDLGRYEEALASFAEALRLKPDYPDPRWNRSLVWLLQGKFSQGWPEFECRWGLNDKPRLDLGQLVWDGQPRAGRTVLVHAEQGLGDTFQFIRYAPLVKQHGGQVVVECQPPLRTLLARCPDIDQVTARGDPLPAFDLRVPLLSLPGILGTRLDTIPDRVPYLWADPARVDHWRRILAATPGFTVAISWHGNPRNSRNRQRSAPLDEFAALARVPGVRLLSLQQGPGREQLSALAGRFAVTDLSGRAETPAESWEDTAALLCAVDLVVTVDTALAHLAGGLGVPVWVALWFAADWRWLLDREDSPWYPTMRLFRQKQLGQWPEVFDRIAAALRQLTAGRTAGN